MYLVREWNRGFFISVIAPWLLVLIGINLVERFNPILSSDRKRVSYMAFFVAYI